MRRELTVSDNIHSVQLSQALSLNVCVIEELGEKWKTIEFLIVLRLFCSNEYANFGAVSLHLGFY